MHLIKLTNSELLAIVDPEDWEVLNRYNWTCLDGYAFTAIQNLRLPMHRMVLGSEGFGQKLVDHINGDRLDNRKFNLRLASGSENSRNQGLAKNNTTGYKGVCKTKHGTYRAQIQSSKDKFSLQLGQFKTAIEAALAYDQASIKHFGVYGRLNFKCDSAPENSYIYESFEVSPGFHACDPPSEK